MEYKDLPVYVGNKDNCEVCKKKFSDGEVIMANNDGTATCYTDGDGGCVLRYIFTAGKMVIGNPMIFGQSGKMTEVKKDQKESLWSKIKRLM